MRLESLLILLFSLVFACSEKRSVDAGGDDGAIQQSADAKPFLGSSDRRAPDNLASISKNNIEAAINQQVNIYLSRPSSSRSTDCNEQIFRSIKAEARGKTLLINAETTVDECRPSNATSGGSMKNVKFKILLIVECDARSLAEFSGKSFDELQNFASFCRSGKVLLNQRLTGELQISANDLDVEAELEIVDGMMDSTGRTCQLREKDDLSILDNCSRFTKQVYSRVQVTGKGSEEVNDASLFPNSIFEIKHTSSSFDSGDDKYFTAGEATIRLNNWRGEIKYRGKNKAPEWTASSGGEKISGTFSPN